MERRTLLLAAPAALSVASALAQPSWPTRPVRIVVPFAPGSFTDIAARVLGQDLTESLGQPFVVENRGGAGGTIGATVVARAAPDGTTFLLSDSSLAMAVGLYPNLPYDPLRDLMPVAIVAESPSILLARPGLGVRTLGEFLSLARSRPGELTFGSGGQGSSAHLATERLQLTGGVRMTHVPYRGVAAAISDVIAGRIDVSIASLASGIGGVRAGTLVGLAVSGAARNPSLPEVPTFAEAGLPGYDMIYWFAMAAPAGTPPEVVARLSAEIVAASRKPRLRETFEAQGAAPVASSPEAMSALLTREVATWRDVVARAGVRPE